MSQAALVLLILAAAVALFAGGLLTLIGTPPNLVVSQALREATGEGLEFLSLTPYGLVALAAGIALMATAGRFLLPPPRPGVAAAEEPSLRELVELFGLSGRIALCRLPEGSPFAGRTAAAVGARRNHGRARRAPPGRWRCWR